MAIHFDTDQFKKKMENNVSKEESNEDKNISSDLEEDAQPNINDAAQNNNTYNIKEMEVLNEEIKKKELKKRYNFSLRPSINRTILIESKKRGLNKSELIELLVEQAFKKGDK